MVEIERESIPLDVLFVGGGPAGLAGAIRLKRLADAHNAASPASAVELEIGVIDKAREFGQHAISGAVIKPGPLRELFPDLADRACPLELQVRDNRFVVLTRSRALAVPGFLVPRQNRHAGDYWTISLGRLVAWLAAEAEAAGVYCFADTCGVELLHEDGRVVGVRTGDKGLDREANPKGNFQPGMDLRATVTVLCEGPRGTLAEDLIDRYSLRSGCNPQVYALGVKETIRVPADTPRRGTVVHTLGHPLPGYAFGGGFLYELADNHYTLGLVVGLDHGNPLLDVHEEFIRWKAHPYINHFIEGGEIVSYGAKVIPEGGFFSLPRLHAPGALLTGDSAGFVNVSQLKGVHHAMRTGMLAAETAFDAVRHQDASDARLSAYQDKVMGHPMMKELWADRNFRHAFRHGVLPGLFLSQAYAFFGGGPRTRPAVRPDWQAWKPASSFTPRPTVPKGPLLLDKLTDVDRSRTDHREDQPSHIRIVEPDLCGETCIPRHGSPPCAHFCPAQVYELEEHDARQSIRVNFSNCVHCKTCVIVDPCATSATGDIQNIDWRAPTEGGPRYQIL
ncbi:MAG: 4Fe-4S dicluster domain-containing protein [Acidobacteriota bacterium]